VYLKETYGRGGFRTAEGNVIMNQIMKDREEIFCFVQVVFSKNLNIDILNARKCGTETSILVYDFLLCTSAVHGLHQKVTTGFFLSEQNCLL
jgi:hypothetical protein